MAAALQRLAGECTDLDLGRTLVTGIAGVWKIQLLVLAFASS